MSVTVHVHAGLYLLAGHGVLKINCSEMIRKVARSRLYRQFQVVT